MTRPQYSYPDGPYVSFKEFEPGVQEAIGKAATWNDLCKFVDDLQLAQTFGYTYPPGLSLTSPLTTKGDIWCYSDNGDDRHPVGTNDAVLLADSSQTTGLRWSDGDWLPSGLTYNRWYRVSINSSTTTFDTIFVASYTASGSSTAELEDGGGHYRAIACSATVGGLGRLTSATYDEIQTRWRPRGWFTIRTTDTSTELNDVRIWCGFASADPSGSSTPAITLAAFRYATDVDGTAFWRCVTDNGTGSPAVTVTTTAVAVSTRYRMLIDARDSTSIKFYINDTLVATHTTTLPVNTTDMGGTFQIRQLATSIVKRFYFSNWFVRHE